MTKRDKLIYAEIDRQFKDLTETIVYIIWPITDRKLTIEELKEDWIDMERNVLSDTLIQSALDSPDLWIEVEERGGEVDEPHTPEEMAEITEKDIWVEKKMIRLRML